MDKQRAIELLKKKSKEAVSVASLPRNNNEYLPWRRNIEDILESAFGSTSSVYKRVTDIFAKPIKGTPTMLQRAYVARVHTIQLEIESIIQNAKILEIEEKPSVIKVPPQDVLQEVPPKAFISHGKESPALRKLKEFIETLGMETIIVKKQASLDKDLPDKVNLYLTQADFVIILATADDKVEDKLQPRQNVIHEIGLAQKTHPGKIIYLLEEGTEFPSNIRPKVWESFKQRNMMNAFLGIVRELRAYGMLKVTKYPKKEHSS